MVPTSESCGRSARGGFGGGGGAFATGTDATAGGGGRRDDEKIGRSRVLDKFASGIAQSGLALGVRSAAADRCSGGFTTSGAGAAGESQSDDAETASARRRASTSMSAVSVGSAEVEAGTQSAAASRSASPVVARLRIGPVCVISRPSIARRPRAGCAACHRLTLRSSPGPAPPADRRTGRACRPRHRRVAAASPAGRCRSLR
jgi:hypothetical protein